MILVFVGGTGSLGREILLNHNNRLLDNHIHRIIVISRDEIKQDQLRKDYKKKDRLPIDLFLGDCTNEKRMKFALQDADYCIHASALKIVPKFEVDVPTGYETNVLGTFNVCQGFVVAPKAKNLLFVSTDKACYPINAYGVSKLAAEHIVKWHNTFQNKVKFRSIRYGNVFGSRGSVVEHWTELAKMGKKLPLTDRDMTRFFITLKNAANFVIDNLFGPQKFFINDLRTPYLKAANMTDLGRVIFDRFNRNKNGDIFEIIGVRPGEKIHEQIRENLETSEEAEKFSEEELKEMYEEWLCSQGL